MEYLERFFFFPTKCDKYTDENVTCIDDHYVYVRKASIPNNSRCLLVAKGNKGNLTTHSTYALLDLFDHCYPLDINIYIIEYPGFGLQHSKQVSIKNCTDCIKFWLEYLSARYDLVDCLGLSMGGGLMVETLCQTKYHVNNLYIVNSYTHLFGAIYDIAPITYCILSTIFDEDKYLDTQTHLDQLNVEKIIILHSKGDTLMPYELTLYDSIHIKDKEFIEITGEHNELLWI